MQKQHQIRRIRFGHRSGPARDIARDSISLELSLEGSLEMRLEEQHQNWRSGSLAVSARHPVPDARAAALFEQNEVGCLRALANLSPSFHCNSPLPQPAARCERSRAPRWPGQKARGGQRRKLACERSAKAFPKMPARASAPDPPAFRSLRSLQNKPGGQARCALSPCSLGLAKAPRNPRRSLGSARNFGGCFGSGPGGPARTFAGKRESSCRIRSKLGSASKPRMLQVKPPLAGVRSQRGGSSCSGCWGNLRTAFRWGTRKPVCPTRAGCERSPEIPRVSAASISIAAHRTVQTKFKRLSIKFNQFFK